MIKRILPIVVVLAVLGAGGYYAYGRLNTAKTSASATLSTTTASTGTLVARWRPGRAGLAAERQRHLGAERRGWPGDV